jgi:type I restriction enzyme S subunit
VTEWPEVQIQDVAVVYDGPHATPTSPKTATAGPIFLGISSLQDGRLDLGQSGFLSDEDFARWTRRVAPQAGDVVFSYETRLGQAAIVPIGLQCALGRRLALMRPDQRVIDPRFLLYSYLGRFPLLLPPLSEQREIATTLGALDDKIESNRRTIDICSRLLDATSSSLALELESVPLSLLAVPLRDAFAPSAVGAELIDHFSIPAFDANGLPDRTSGASVISAKLRVDQPSVLVSRLNPATNRTWLAVPEPGVTAGCSTEFLVLTPAAGVTLGSLWLAVRDEGFRSLLAQRASGTSGSHQRVKAQDALMTEVPDARQLPAAEAQAADELLWLMHQRRVESMRLAALRDALLPELLSGRIRVPDAGEAFYSALA